MLGKIFKLPRNPARRTKCNCKLIIILLFILYDRFLTKMALYAFQTINIHAISRSPYDRSIHFKRTYTKYKRLITAVSVKFFPCLIINPNVLYELEMQWTTWKPKLPSKMAPKSFMVFGREQTISCSMANYWSDTKLFYYKAKSLPQIFVFFYIYTKHNQFMSMSIQCKLKNMNERIQYVFAEFPIKIFIRFICELATCVTGNRCLCT